MKGTNYSSKRESIYNAIISTRSHPSARSVYDSLKPHIPDLSLGTVYRNLALFKEQGIVNCVANVCGQDRYDGDTSEHAHFVCDKCQAIIDINNSGEITDIERSLIDKGFEITGKNVVFHGICRDCCSK